MDNARKEATAIKAMFGKKVEKGKEGGEKPAPAR